MSGETEQDVSAWTPDILHAHFDRLLAERSRLYEQRFADIGKLYEQRFADLMQLNEQRFQAQEQAVSAALLATEKAGNKAEGATADHFESVNRFRETLTEQAKSFLTRAEFDQRSKAIDDQLNVAERQANRIEIAQSHMQGRIIAMAGVAAVILPIMVALLLLIK